MRRFLADSFTFGPKSTALKILYTMKDVYRKNSPEAKDMDSDEIANRSYLIEQLGAAVSEAINYEAYQQLSDSEKFNVRLSIAKELYNHVQKYESTYHDAQHWDDYEWGNGIYYDELVSRGMVFSTEKGSQNEVVVTAINFPKDLFANIQDLKAHIQNALLVEHFGLLKETPNRIDEIYDNFYHL